ncbi:dTDP-4-dehydrorhamnose 3,5-epimerase family protein [Micromonospora sp. HM5-17]|uniref:dTDP-4-dehydrorhamnose 3,5-epimerase family protein n=1 Tax=Micromonospora sp. HM5-17 TaxID=2487710 RepID=UPI000F4A7530|nr:dTDP-4-dehydrorhamnose 3,5-epimerase [Micromonospora sp. HM5-17]ROT33601.1 dTDP-4-keto-6-deoxy-D-glucose epimerase [Micromonospora sp. HM5-17]
MKATELSIPGAWEFAPPVFPDERGSFLVWYDAAVFADALGFELTVAQVNQSVSRRGVIRGVHWADVPVGQAKYVYCPRGAVLDVVVDLRIGSPTFGRHEVVRLDSVDHRAVYLSEGLGHAFVALEEESVVTYYCSARYAPARERVVHVRDPELALTWPDDLTPILSERDAAAPTLAELRRAGLLPDYGECQRLYQAHRTTRPAPRLASR